MDYKNLFDMCFKHSDNLFILLSDGLVIIDINSSTEKILGWKKKDVCNKHVDVIFNQSATEPFITTNRHQKKIINVTEAKKGNNVLKITWKIIPLNSVDNIIFISGKVSTSTTHNKYDNAPLDNIVRYAPGLVYWKDKNSVYRGCNEEFARLAGLGASEDVKGKTDFDLPWKDGAKLYIAADQQVIKTGKPNLNIEEVIATSDNKKITVVSNKVPLLDSKNRVVGIMGITTDITHQKEIEYDLKKSKEGAEAANLAKTEFIANMSHDIRTPLAGVVGMSQLLVDGAQNLEQKQYAHWLYDSGNQLLEMLNGILDVVSADNVNEADITEEAFDLHKLIQDLVQLERPSTELMHLGLHVNIDESVPQHIISDRTKLHRVLLNLLGNAIKFTTSGHITIEVKCLGKDKEQTRLQFGVADTGIGIPLELQNKVFDRFYRVTPSYKGTYEGHGVGLHIAQSYVKLLGGHIILTSQEGVGTTFYFDLSCKISHENDAKEYSSLKPVKPPILPASQPDMTTALSGNELHILLVEDNVVALKMAEIMVSKAGYRFTSAVDGEQALRLVSLEVFDLILTDIGLPGISGHEFTRSVRQLEAGLNKTAVPIIGLTAHARESAKDECLQAGMNDVFTKPLSLTMLQTIVNQWVLPAQDDKPHKNNANNSKSPKKLGIDLPSNEEQLFELDAFPVLDIKSAIESIGNENMLREILLMVNTTILNDSIAIEAAYKVKNWETIEKLAHKLKGGAVYCGTIKLKYACQYLERYQKAGHTALLEKLYQQLMRVLKETEQGIEQWLIASPSS